MTLTVTGRKHETTRQWADALADVIVRHPTPSTHLLLTLEDEPQPMLSFEIDRNADSLDPSNILSPFRITNVRLTYFPGVMLARKWLAAGWAAFLQHEALELVTIGDLKTRALDPHESREALDHIFHRALPPQLTPASLVEALTTAMPRSAIEALLGGK